MFSKLARLWHLLSFKLGDTLELNDKQCDKLMTLQFNNQELDCRQLDLKFKSLLKRKWQGGTFNFQKD